MSALWLAQAWDHMDLDGGGWLLMMAGMAIVWGLIAVGVVWLVRELALRDRRPHPAAEEPLDLLARRLASGEISIAEYDERREALQRRS